MCDKNANTQDGEVHGVKDNVISMELFYPS